jgi:predicted amidohydrolase
LRWDLRSDRFSDRHEFVHYDNFSHWAVVVKSMLIENQIPTAASAIIDFKSYRWAVRRFSITSAA